MKARIYVTSVFVDDQAKALAFYTGKLGFVPKTDFPVGAHRWLTVVGADAPDGVELLLEPDENPAAQAYKQSLAEQGIPAASFAVDDVEEAYRTLQADGVTFVQTPTPMGPVVGAVLDDTCGNLIQLVSPA
ncbi:VOC family protein [Solwaraspora sp. WMMD791]|uniref:VOC family protein n=1 Tax=Solwaraspora sp. WMMD791 TaxID=3016086 RepID=UPI00249A7A81|nr:VOC family protein [Solwaraspora sp. WMMD791]WFE26709.1 VOC family protein [Solwaraspora sp. WMMD791]